jgi:hypothetical protein
MEVAVKVASHMIDIRRMKITNRKLLLMAGIRIISCPRGLEPYVYLSEWIRLVWRRISEDHMNNGEFGG